ncbi:MAG: hypothetical protein HKP30_09975 [Myxococcales bacterium]|nr:hypothetical protein [Myxococcales bacterium]
MREIWGPALFATALCAIVLVANAFGHGSAGAPALLCFLPVVFFQLCGMIKTLNERVEQLERSQRS